MAVTISGTNGFTMPDASAIASGEQVSKGWINFNGTGAVAVRDSYNVSSVTDNGTGDYTVNWASPLANANYCFLVSAGVSGTVPSSSGRGPIVSALTTTTARVVMTTGTGAATDYDIVTCCTFVGN